MTMSGITMLVIPWARLPSVIAKPSPRSVALRQVYCSPAQASAKTRPVDAVGEAGSGTPTRIAAATPKATPMISSAVGPPSSATKVAAIGGPTMVAAT